MRWLDVLRLRLRSVFRRNQVETELDEELRFHYDSLVESYQARGLSAEEARRRAHIESGMPESVREQCRDARGLNVIENLRRDVVYALRGLVRAPGFTLTALLAIALGIGANTALFSLVYAVVLRPLPVPQPDTIHNVHVSTRGPGNRSHFGTQYFVAWSEFLQMRAGAKTADLAGIAQVEMSRKGDSRPVRTQLVSENLLPILGARPMLGRFFTADETSKPGSAPVVVLSHRVWRDWFGSSRSVVGSLVVLNRNAFTIIGVADEATNGPLMQTPDVWIPLSMQPITRPGDRLLENPANAWVQLFARRKAGYDEAALRAEMAVLAKNAVSQTLRQRTVMVDVPTAAFLNFPFVRQQMAPILGILFLAVALVLIVACANVANMLLARGLSRRREIAIRLSIGAGRGRLIQQLLTESLLLSAIGAVCGVFVAQFASRGLLALIPAGMMGSHQLNVSPDGRVLLFTMAVAIVTGLVFGLVPAMGALRFEVAPSLKTEGLEGAARRGSGRLQNLLIGVQVAVSLVLLVNAGLLVRGFQRSFSFDTGQDMSHVLVADLDLRQQQYTGETADRFVNTLRENISTAPGVVSVSNTFVEPLHEQCGREASTGGENFFVSCDEVGPDYFRAAGIPLLHGRDFTLADVRGKTPVTIIDDRFARDKLGTENAVGKTLRSIDSEYQVVGVVRATRPLDPTSRVAPKLYLPMRGPRHLEAKMIVRYEGDPSGPTEALRKAAGALDGNVNVTVRRVEESFGAAVTPVRIAAAGASALGGLALLLASTGIYGVVSFAIGRRRREVGIRMALGASRAAVLRLMLWQGLKPVVVGGVVGFVLAGVSAQLIRALLYGVSPFDPVAFAATCGLLTVVALAAMAVPVRQAVRVDPAVTLRYE